MAASAGDSPSAPQSACRAPATNAPKRGGGWRVRLRSTSQRCAGTTDTASERQAKPEGDAPDGVRCAAAATAMMDGSGGGGVPPATPRWSEGPVSITAPRRWRPAGTAEGTNSQRLTSLPLPEKASESQLVSDSPSDRTSSTPTASASPSAAAAAARSDTRPPIASAVG
eukprot:349717-Chlamydomonas_euryale.AAC.2